MKQVFISYSSLETTQAYNLVQMLENLGISCWIAPRDIPIGSDYIDQIPDGIEACPCFLVLLSPSSQASQWVRMELSQAVDERKCIFPLLLEDFPVSRGFKFLLRNTQIRPYFQDPDATLREIITRIPGQSAQAEPPRAAAPAYTGQSTEEIYKTAWRFYDAGAYDQAVQYFQAAADRSHPSAQNMLGYCYDTGKGVDQNYITAVTWYRKAMASGNIAAMRHLGYSYEFGHGVEQDLEEAKNLYTQAIARGDARAADHLKRLNATIAKNADSSAEECFRKGEAAYTAQNYTEAVKWYQKAAGQGHAEAQYWLGYFSDKGEICTQDDKIAAKWYQKAAEQGHMAAQRNLGIFCEFGRGVTQSYENAAIWYQKAARQRDPYAQYHLGYFYDKGYYYPQDDTAAAEWYRKAAEQGHRESQRNLGIFCEFGRGVPKSYTDAIEWYQKAANQGDFYAQYNLACCYEYGKGIKKNKSEAKRWYQKAANQGYEVAQKALERLK